ncbi:Uroporphyrinogen-III C-methyltransferase [Fervidicola ferrireducens]|uniref:uroporphyrinogen-III C-methyltransferase n=1 Tax=Fervidicola ferrireducens TaxID=520764 RepID=A0A140LB30_9FIRM|nr:uroporphyrinogen-III C-methyltransferase [Fervidicola ferrireducens]KXG77755.1 Uroporphyrinogen-III C-methyltransferase [Fervidicola ferrireducens]
MRSCWVMKMAGKVYLVGAGPGDAGLLTLRGKELLKKADVVLYDRLVNPEILKFAREDAELIDVGKSPGEIPVPQDEINKLLFEKARENRLVVRLKGGDPFVFGRGSEEALYLAERKIPVEIVPGITSAVAVPAYAGIPVTCRGFCSSFHVFAGSEDVADKFDWKCISKLEGTLVFLMGVKNIDYIAKNLIENGKNPLTPSAMTMWGTTGMQKTVVSNLAKIAEKAQNAGIENPAVLVVGETVSLREYLNWFEKKPLFGKRILATGSGDDFPLLKELGAQVISCPTIKIVFDFEESQKALDKMMDSDLVIFSSPNAVKSIVSAMRKAGFDVRNLARVTLAAVGKRTAEILKENLLFPEILPEKYTSGDFLKAIPPSKRGGRALVITSDIGGKELVKGLEDLGYEAVKVAAYRNLPNAGEKWRILKEAEMGFDAAVFTSPSTFMYLEQLIEDLSFLKGKTMIVSIGPTTAKAIEKRGLKVDLMPEENTLEGIEKALLELWMGRGKYADFEKT